MSKERRRYFRINETVGITYQVIDGDETALSEGESTPDILELVSKQDEQIEKLLIEVGKENPKVAELITVFNLKLERIVNQLVIESQLVGRIAHRVKEANISACGIAFSNNEPISEGARVRMELRLYPSDKSLIADGVVVGCEEADPTHWYWRVDFFGMSDQAQEILIQHIVQCQSQQLKKTRGS